MFAQIPWKWVVFSQVCALRRLYSCGFQRQEWTNNIALNQVTSSHNPILSTRRMLSRAAQPVQLLIVQGDLECQTVPGRWPTRVSPTTLRSAYLSMLDCPRISIEDRTPQCRMECSMLRPRLFDELPHGRGRFTRLTHNQSQFSCDSHGIYTRYCYWSSKGNTLLDYSKAQHDLHQVERSYTTANQARMAKMSHKNARKAIKKTNFARVFFMNVKKHPCISTSQRAKQVHKRHSYARSGNGGRCYGWPAWLYRPCQPAQLKTRRSERLQLRSEK